MAEIREKGRAFSELYRVLRPDGTLSITEEFLDPDYPFPCETRRRAVMAGFRFLRRTGGLWTYTANFSKPVSGQKMA
jgi:ubiquinone/menaquinone biosynthesis C-methylase UbiE